MTPRYKPKNKLVFKSLKTKTGLMGFKEFKEKN